MITIRRGRMTHGAACLVACVALGSATSDPQPVTRIDVVPDAVHGEVGSMSTTRTDSRASLWRLGPSRVEPIHKSREALWTLRRNHQEFECTLISHGEYGTEVQVAKNGVFLWATRFNLRRDAIVFAESERRLLLQD
jgi:hypothetical protein